MKSARGWPFMIGAGRHRDYSVLMAPDFLVAAAAHGRLGDVVSPAPPDTPARVASVSAATGLRLGLAYATHVVTAADVDRPRDDHGRPRDDDGGPRDDPGRPRDDHGRPLRFIYGFACPDGRIDAVATADLETAREASLAVYRRFLAYEDTFTTETSASFPLRSTVAAWPVREIHVGAGSVRRPRRLVVAGSATAAVVAALVTAALLVAGPGDRPAPGDTPRPSPPPTTTSPTPGARPGAGAAIECRR